MRAPAFGIAIMTPVLLAGAVAASPDRPTVSAPVAAAPSAPPPAASPARAAAPVGGASRIPASALSAYRRAEQTMSAAAPGCGVSWNLLAGIGHLEASPGSTAVHAVQSRPSAKISSANWKRFASDGDGDGKSDPKNPFDAALATARQLCSSGLNFHNQAQVLTALLRYNNSMAFARSVLGWAATYATGSVPLNLPPIFGPVPVLGPQLPASPWIGEPQTPLLLGTGTQAGYLLPGPAPSVAAPALPAQSAPPPVDPSPPQPALRVEPLPATAPVAILADPGKPEAPVALAPQGDRARIDVNVPDVAPQPPAPPPPVPEPNVPVPNVPEPPAPEPPANGGGGRLAGRSQSNGPSEPSAQSPGDNGGDGQKGGGGRRGKSNNG